MTIPFRYQLTLLALEDQCPSTSSFETSKTLVSVAREVAQTLPQAYWIRGTAVVLLVERDYSSIQLAVSLAGGTEWDVEPLPSLAAPRFKVRSSPLIRVQSIPQSWLVRLVISSTVIVTLLQFERTQGTALPGSLLQLAAIVMGIGPGYAGVMVIVLHRVWRKSVPFLTHLLIGWLLGLMVVLLRVSFAAPVQILSLVLELVWIVLGLVMIALWAIQIYTAPEEL
jgi:hypothetical protein